MEKSLFLDRRGNGGGSKGHVCSPSFPILQRKQVLLEESVCCSKTFSMLYHQGLSSEGYTVDKWPFWPMTLVIDHLLERTEKGGYLRAGETFLWPGIHKSRGLSDLQDPVLVCVAPENGPYCNDTWMFYSPIYLDMTILIELSDCWRLSCFIQILGIIKKEIPRGSRQLDSTWNAKFMGVVLPACLYLARDSGELLGSCLNDYVKKPGFCRGVSGKHVVCTAGSITLKYQSAWIEALMKDVSVDLGKLSTH